MDLTSLDVFSVILGLNADQMNNLDAGDLAANANKILALGAQIQGLSLTRKDTLLMALNLNADSRVNILDYTIISQNFGRTLP